MKPTQKPVPRRRLSKRRGVGMIEVLVSLVIFAFGMLGLAALQSRALTSGHQSLLRAQATALTDDVLDRMRADRSDAVAGNWNTVFDDAPTSITGTEIYRTDLKDWKTAVAALLPEGKAGIQVEADGAVTVIIQWNEGNAVGGDTSQQLQTLSRL